jgi:hypothetical protein
MGKNHRGNHIGGGKEIGSGEQRWTRRDDDMMIGSKVARMIGQGILWYVLEG